MSGQNGCISRQSVIEVTVYRIMDFDASISGRPVIGGAIYHIALSVLYNLKLLILKLNLIKLHHVQGMNGIKLRFGFIQFKSR